ncbi:MAG: hypothetical protein KDD42_02645, partial [Bdellovibrionales bacterium]|nr:hypothetical protein [Bdellovibrionales bacterium]
LRIPHIFRTPFYVPGYPFGMLLAYSIYQRYRDEGPAFAEKAVQFISKGGSQRPAEAVAELGMDINSQQFWHGAFDPIRAMLKRLEDITK